MSARDLIVFGEDWGSHPSSTQHIVSHLAANRRVLWVNSLGLRRPKLSLRDIARAGAKLKSAFSARPAAKTPDRSHMRIVNPLAVSWPGSRLAGEVNRRILGRKLRAAIKEAGLVKPVLWTSLPTALPLVGELDESALVYYCGDDFSALAGVDHEPVTRMERTLATRADLIIAASEPLADRFRGKPTLLAPHGVDFDLFTTPAPRAPDLPDAPLIAGFYGALADWIDIEALAQAAHALPHWEFVFIGPVQTDVSRLREAANVRLLGPRPHAQLPSYSQHWTVSMLPFRDNAQIHACNPLKLREYLAAGSPVVSARFPAMAPYADCIRVYESGGELAAALTDAAQDQSRNGVRRARVALESWSARAASISAALEQV